LSMTFEALRETVSRCGESFFLFGVFKEEALVAAAIDIVITEKILYNFYPAHTKKMDALSPVVMLMDGVYSWCKKRQIELLDLGTSASGNLPNFGLLDFKFRLGGQPSIRYTFEKELTG
jgi:lipid II:glycine glycyltransferase (peptidoglycan interpeptide bridge formation enzyme)